MSSHQNVLITGANGALGEVVVSRFVSAGYRVFGAVHSGTGQRKECTYLSADLSNSAQVESLVSKIEKSGPIEHLVHCAGGFRYSTVDAMSEADLDFLVSANFRSAVHLARALVPRMRKRNSGRIVFVSSKATFAPSAGMTVYAATKAALNALTLGLAEEVKDTQIRVNAVLPTIIDTEANRREMAGSDFKKWVPREDLAEIIFSLTQSYGDAIHGALIPVAGRM